MALHKVHGFVNLADLVTKHQAAVTKHSALSTCGCRAESAPVLSSLRTAAVRDTLRSPSGSMGDTWAVDAEEAVREHRKPRRKLFTHLRVAGGLPAKGLIKACITEGRFLDIGEVLERVDTWTARGSAHEDFGRRWTGRTRFLGRAGADKELLEAGAGRLPAEPEARRTEDSKLRDGGPSKVKKFEAEVKKSS